MVEIKYKELTKIKITQLTKKGGEYYYWKAGTGSGERELQSMWDFFNSNSALECWCEEDVKELREFINQKCKEWQESRE